jgi:hypothetical protein
MTFTAARSGRPAVRCCPVSAARWWRAVLLCRFMDDTIQRSSWGYLGLGSLLGTGGEGQVGHTAYR